MKGKQTSWQYIDVAPAIPLPSSARQLFTYRGDSALERLDAVTMPFGPRSIQGVIVKTGVPRPQYPTKDATALPKAQSITPLQYQFGTWLSAHMRGSLGYTLRLFLGPKNISKPSRQSKTPSDLSMVLEMDEQKRLAAVQELCLSVQASQQQILILVPEVSQIAAVQTAFEDMKNVHGVFAGQPQAQKRLAWQAVAAGEPVIIIGTQKALFLPWQNLGLVVVEQAQFPTHKLWDQYPRLDNRYGARQLAEIHSAPLVLSGSTPSLEMWHALQSGAALIANNPYMPSSVVMTSSFEDKKNRRILPHETTILMRRALKAGKKIFVLYNKRGIWQAMRCRKCFASVRCADCDVVALVQGKAAAKKGKRSAWQLVCRNCSKRVPTPTKCPECGLEALAPNRLGSVTMQSILTSLNPGQTISRLDADSLQGMKEVEIAKKISGSNLIIGTNAALTHLGSHSFDYVFWVFPEDALSYPDIRTSERAWLLLARLGQLARKPVHLVTRQPQLISDTIGQKPEVFLRNQLKERQRLHYPPFTDLVRLTFAGKKQIQAEKARLMLKKNLGKNAKIRGPYHGLDKSRRAQGQTYILLTGKLSVLQAAYEQVPCDSADVAPDRII